MSTKTLVPAIVDGQQVYVPADQIVSASQAALTSKEDSFGSYVKAGAGIAVGVVLVAVAAELLFGSRR